MPVQTLSGYCMSMELLIQEEVELGLILASPKGIITEHALRFNFDTSNNRAKYEALIVGLEMTKELNVKKLEVFTDSQLVVGQIRGQFEVKDSILSQIYIM